MIAYQLCVFLVGAVFGLRFKVMVLLPLTIAIALATPFIGLLDHLTFFEGLKGFALCIVALNAGYVFGSFARPTIAAARSTRLLARPIKVMR
jgi:hypothetical protein